MSYFQLRLTIPLMDASVSSREEATKFYPLFRLILLKKAMLSEPHVLGYEVLDKYGDKTDPHFHFNFVCEDSKETFRRWLKNNVASLFSIQLCGNAMYCLKCVNEPNDLGNWVRYCMKEIYVKRFFNYDWCDKDTAKSWLSTARIENARRHIHNNNIRDKERIKKTLFDRMSIAANEHFDLSSNTVDKKSVFCFFFDYYKQEKKAINIQTLDGYTILYLANIGVYNGSYMFKTYSSLFSSIYSNT